MFTKEKVIDQQRIAKIQNIVGDVQSIPYRHRGDKLIKYMQSFLSFDEMKYLFYDSRFVVLLRTEEIYSFYNYIGSWELVINRINDCIDKGFNIERYLSNLSAESISILPVVFGFDREGVELTEQGIRVSKAINSLVSYLNDFLNNEQKEIINKRLHEGDIFGELLNKSAHKGI